MPRKITPRHAYTGPGARVGTDRHGTVTVIGVRDNGRVLVTRDRAGHRWDLHRSGSRWTVRAPRGGTR